MTQSEKPPHRAYELRWDWVRFVNSLKIKPNSSKTVAHGIGWSVNRDNGRAYRSQKMYAVMSGISYRQTRYGMEALEDHRLIINHALETETPNIELLRLDEIPAALEALDKIISPKKGGKVLPARTDSGVAKDRQLGGNVLPERRQTVATNLNIPKHLPKESADEEADETFLESLIQRIELTDSSGSELLPKAANEEEATTKIVRALKLATRNEYAFSEIYQKLAQPVRTAMIRRVIAGTLEKSMVYRIAVAVGAVPRSSEVEAAR